MSIEFTRVPLYNNNIPKKEVTSMDNVNRNISIQDIEEIHRKTEMIAGLSDFCVIFFTNYFENDIFKRTLECLSDEVFKLRDECRALYNNIGSHNNSKTHN